VRPLIGLAALVFVLGAAARSAADGKVEVRYPTVKAFRILDEAETILGRLAAHGNANAAEALKEVPGLRGSLQRLNTAAGGLLALDRAQTDTGAVVVHNAEIDRLMELKIRPFCARAEGILRQSGLEFPAMMVEIASGLVQSPAFQAAGGTRGRSEAFVAAFARQAYGYSGFQLRTANAIVDLMRRLPAEWKPLHDASRGITGRAGLQEAMGDAQRLANEGYLVVVGRRNGNAGQFGGQLAVVLPGELAACDDWEKAGQPHLLPQSAQGGEPAFAGKPLGCGFPADAAASPDFVVYYRKP
jgi:hypothetical protein